MRPVPDHLRRQAAQTAATLLLLLAATANAATVLPADGADFRAATWGMTRAQVNRTEPDPPSHDQGPLLIYDAVVDERPCRIVYMFRDNKLCMGFYQWSDTHEELESYFADVEHVRDILSASIEEPQVEKWHWEDKMFAEDPALRAEALGLGLVRYELGWMTDRSIVAMRMSGGDFKADILLMYGDRRCFPRGQDTFGDFFASAVGLPSPYFR